MTSLHNLSRVSLTKSQGAPSSSSTSADSRGVLVREAGVPFRPPSGNIDPFAEWLSLMEVVQMLCPAWPVRDKPLVGKEWRL